jgi:gliding motility-associated-like protein
VSPLTTTGSQKGLEEIILTAVYINNCGDTSISSASIPIVDYIPITLVAPDLALDCPDEPVPVVATATGGFENLHYLWANGETTGTIMVPGDESSSYQITVSDDCGHSVTDLVVVDAGCEVIIPNVFSPNGDGTNDEFIIAGIQGTENNVRVFNRWGQVVYEAQNYRNNWEAKDLPDGTYYYEVIVAGEPLSPYTAI